VSVLLSGPIVAQYGVVYVADPNTGLPIAESAVCNIREDRYARRAFEVATFLFFCVPMTVIGVLYGLIWIVIRRRSAELARRGSCDCGGPGAMRTAISGGGGGGGGALLGTLTAGGRSGKLAVGTQPLRSIRSASPAAVGSAAVGRREQIGSVALSAATGSTSAVGYEEPSRSKHLITARRAVLKMLGNYQHVQFISEIEDA
jgi:hypothetical protein